MQKRALLALTLAAAMLAGCGAQGVPSAARANAAALTAKAKKAQLDPKVDADDYAAGLEVGLAKAAGKTVAPKVKQGSVDKLSYDYGYVVGLITGSINSFNRINGSFDVSQWKSFCYMNFNAMKEAQDALKANPELLAKCPVPAGILEGGIASFSSINGSFDVSQWKSFAYTNRKILESTLTALKNVQL